MGLGPHYPVEQTLHHARLFVVIVGKSSKARKGTSWDNVRGIVSRADEPWAARITSGLSSGEGLIWNVRDPIVKQNRDGTERVEDGGISDKRLLVVESEFAGLLRAGRRETNTLSPVIRDAWDKTTLRTMTKNSPARATGAHVTIIGHITLAELRKTLSETDCLNGFGNRFLFVCAVRSKLLPDGGNLSEAELDNFGKRLRLALAQIQGIHTMTRSPEAAALWHAAYPTLSGDRPGLFGTLTSRAEAQVLRIAIIYALLDASPIISASHLRAALEVWRYCEDSARYIFGDALENKEAEKIRGLLDTVGEVGMTRTEILKAFANKIPPHDLDHALKALESAGLAHFAEEPTAGRPAQRWFAGARKAI